MRYTLALTMDPHLDTDMDTIFTLATTPRQVHLTQTLDTPTARQLATAFKAPSPDHSWREATDFNLMRLKCSMKLLNKRKGLSLVSYLTPNNITIDQLLLFFNS